MRPIHRKLARALKRLVTVLRKEPGPAVEPSFSVVEVSSIAAVRAKPDTASAKGCPVCGVDAGVRETRDVIRGEQAGECVMCGALRIVD